MMQHLRVTKAVASSQAKMESGVGRLRIGAVASLCLLWMGLGTNRAPAQSAAPNVARVSFVQGSVQLSGQGSDFQQAVMNMPVLDGSRLQSGADGEAEVEFGDGSVARVTPNSTLQFDHLGQDQVQLEQLAGLSYYEFNVGDGHPSFAVQFSNLNLQPTANAILRLGLDSGWEVAVISGSARVEGSGISPVDVAENQTIHSNTDNGGAPYAVAQGISGDSWDNWNQDRDQAIAQEASQQTPVRDGSANPGDENWNDLDANGNWYPVEGSGNVWVPSGVGAGWDPYGSGYWGYYPTLGYTWISGYPWGWLPYHCGNWNYYNFGWGWAPGGCGRVWSPVVVVRNYPPGWAMPGRPVLHPGGGLHPVPEQRLLAVDRGPVARGPWANGSALRVDHQQSLNFNGRVVAPVGRVDFHSQTFTGFRGTAPGTRAVLNGSAPNPGWQRQSTTTFTSGATPPRAVGRPNQGEMPNQGVRPNPAYSQPQPYNQRSNEAQPYNQHSNQPQPYNQRSNEAQPYNQHSNQAQSYNQRSNEGQSYNQRSNYVSRPMPETHYSPPPQQPHYSSPPQHSGPPPQQSQHMSSPGPHR